MGVSGQFLNVVEFVDPTNSILVIKYQRPAGDDEIKQGSKLIVREGQKAVFVKGGQLADIFGPGTWKLNTRNLPILSTLGAFPYLFKSPIISDLYFVNMSQFVNNSWQTTKPIMKRDKDFNLLRISGQGKYGFHITDVEIFMKQVVGARGYSTTKNVTDYLQAVIVQSFAGILGNVSISVMDLASHYLDIASLIQQEVNVILTDLGIQLTTLVIENIGLPAQVEKLIDEQSGIGIASHNMGDFITYQSARAIRDAAKQKNGFAGIGAGISVGNAIAKTMNQQLDFSSSKKSKTVDRNKKKSGTEESDNSRDSISSRIDELVKYHDLLKQGILTQEEFDEIKKRILGG